MGEAEFFSPVHLATACYACCSQEGAEIHPQTECLVSSLFKDSALFSAFEMLFWLSRNLRVRRPLHVSNSHPEGFFQN
jgi:hypothetical protein